MSKFVLVVSVILQRCMVIIYAMSFSHKFQLLCFSCMVGLFQEECVKSIMSKLTKTFKLAIVPVLSWNDIHIVFKSPPEGCSPRKNSKIWRKKLLVDNPCLGILSQSYQFVWSSKLGHIVETNRLAMGEPSVGKFS